MSKEFLSMFQEKAIKDKKKIVESYVTISLPNLKNSIDYYSEN